MRIKNKHAVRITILVFILASAVVAYNYSSLPAQGARAQSREGPAEKQLFQKVCGTCHALETVTASRRSRAQWEETITKMITLGAKGTEAEFATILSYLVRQYGTETPPPVPVAAVQRPAPPPDQQVVAWDHWINT
jgi:mono/diheme cytochrome c family protein